MNANYPYQHFLTYCDTCGSYLEADAIHCAYCDERAQMECDASIPQCLLHEIETHLANASVDACTADCWGDDGDTRT